MAGCAHGGGARRLDQHAQAVADVVAELIHGSLLHSGGRRTSRSTWSRAAFAGYRARLGRGEPARLLGRLPEEATGPPARWPELRHRLVVEHRATLHDVADVVGVVNILERVGVEHHEVRELAGLQAAEVALETELLRRPNRRVAQRLPRRRTAHHPSPELPVGADALAVAVRA